ncbi:MAG: CBS domain-containing protein [Planctomycetes bacterium]|nr:CBS domain-containing protein [Planctomycetota bacterium]
MSSLPGRLGTLVARDVMTPNVLVLNAGDDLDAAVALLKEHHLTGAPVIDPEGRLVGVLSLADTLEPAAARRFDEEPRLQFPSGSDPDAWRVYEHVVGLHDSGKKRLVSQCMSKDVASVGEEVALIDVARQMCGGHWHRVPVVRHDGQLCGIVSTMDVLAALVNTAEEPD